MKIPNEVKIGAHKYPITFREMDNRCGTSESVGLKITIDSTRPKSVQEETFFHEVIHIIRDLGGIANKDRDIEEQEVQIMGHGFYQFLIDNKLIK